MPIRVIVGGRSVDVAGKDVVTFGRDEACDVRLDHHLASRRHGRLERRDGQWIFVNTSSNGTFHSGEPVTELPLGPGSTILEMPRGGTRIEIVLVGDATVPAQPSKPPEGSIGRLTRVLPVARAKATRIGRGAGNDLELDDLSASRRHAEVRHGAAGLEIVDLGSHNGTFVNGRRVQRARLKDGDIVGIGGVTLRLNGDRLEEYDQQGASWLWAKDISALRGNSKVLSGVDLVIEPSSLVAIVGPSGAGKTTLMDALTGMVPADAGTVSFAGRTLAGSREEWKLHLGHVPQDDLLHTQLSVRQALDYSARLRFPPDVETEARRVRVNEVLGELGIEHRAQLAIGKLSGGQRKRTSIAVELLTRPSLLFLDEPTSGLDPAKEEQVMALLRDLARGGRIVVATTHSLGSLEACDRVLFLAAGGHPAYYGPPSEAVAYFRAHDWGDTFPRIFQLLDGKSGIPWADTYRDHPDRRRYVDDPMTTATVASPTQDAETVSGKAQRPSLSRQTWILTQRYLAIITSERRGAALLVAQAPLMAVLLLLLYDENVMTTERGSEVPMLLWLLVIAVTWLGTSNAIREIVKERPIIRREANVGLSMTAYYLSKTLVLGTITIVQVLAFAALALLGQVFPASGLDYETGVVLPSPLVELALVLVLTGLAAMAVGLAISALIKSSDQAMLLLPLLLVAHVVVSAPIADAPTGPLQYGSWLSSAAWGTAAAASTVGVNDLESLSFEARGEEAPEARSSWGHDVRTWLTNMAALVLITAFASFLTWYVLRRSTTGKPLLDRQE